jgi:hypothetical protein
LHVFTEAFAPTAAKDAIDPLVIISELTNPLRVSVRAQTTKTPNICVCADSVPGAVEEYGETLE